MDSLLPSVVIDLGGDPRNFKFHPTDSDKVAFLVHDVKGFSQLRLLCGLKSGDKHALQVIDLATDILEVASVDYGCSLSREEELRQERTRERFTGITQYFWTPETSAHIRILIPFQGDLFILDQATEFKCLKCIFRKAWTGRTGDALDPQWSPDGARVAFVQSGDVFVVNVPSSRDGSRNIVWPVTCKSVSQFHSNGITRGVADYIAQEELDRYSGYWWAKSGSKLYFQETDENHITDLNVVHFTATDPRKALETHKFPYAGTENAHVRLGVVNVPVFESLVSDSLNGDQTHQCIDNRNEPDVHWFATPFEQNKLDYYLSDVFAAPDDSIIAVILPRSQRFVDVVRFLPGEHYPQRVFREFCVEGHWINTCKSIQVVQYTGLPSSVCQLLWLSERTGYRHIYAYNIDLSTKTSSSLLWSGYSHVSEQTNEAFIGSERERDHSFTQLVHGNADLIATVTDGTWNVKQIIYTCLMTGCVFFTANTCIPIDTSVFVSQLHQFGTKATPAYIGQLASISRQNPISYDWESVLDVGLTEYCSDVKEWGSCNQCVIQKLITVSGNQFAIFSSDLTRSIVTQSSIMQPKRIQMLNLNEIAPDTVLLWQESTDHQTIFAPPSTTNPSQDRLRLFAYPSLDGTTTLFGSVWLPKRTKSTNLVDVPLVVYTYGGPHVQLIQNDWTRLRVAPHLSGYIPEHAAVVTIDNRGSFHRSVAFECAIRDRLGCIEVDDQCAGVQWLAKHKISRGDASSTGVFGWSFGGFMSLMCLMKASDVFGTAVAGAPVTDWQVYDTCYTERYMSTPQENNENYSTKSNVLHYVPKMKGSLLLIHGLLDENVPFRNTAILMDRLMQQELFYDAIVLPSARHGPRTRHEAKHVKLATKRHFETTL